MSTAFFDVDTQLDFLFPAGALPAPGAAALVPKLIDLTRYAASHKLPVISTTDAHSENDPEFAHWPPHCIVGSVGQHKAQGTRLPAAVVMPNVTVMNEHLRAYAAAPQIVVEKQNIDCFTNLSLRPLLDAIDAKRFVVYGVVAEVCVERALFGLLQLGVKVECVVDCICELSEPALRNMLAHFQAAGGTLTTAAEVMAQRDGSSSGSRCAGRPAE